jgi:hypothetical protein
MELSELQRALARLSTDAALREQFLADPEAAGLALGLSPGSGRILAQLPVQPLEAFARSLLYKRMGDVGRLLPHTRRVLGKRFDVLFLEYAMGGTGVAAGGRSPTSPRRIQEDATDFAAFLQRGAEWEPPWVRELARYEAMWLRAQDPRHRWTAGWFHYPVGELIRGLMLGEETPRGLPPRATLAVWLRPRLKGALRHWVVRLPRLLSR